MLASKNDSNEILNHFVVLGSIQHTQDKREMDRNAAHPKMCDVFTDFDSE